MAYLSFGAVLSPGKLVETQLRPHVLHIFMANIESDGLDV